MMLSAPADLLAVIIIRNRKTGDSVRYTMAASWLQKMPAWNKETPLTRYSNAMAEDGLFAVEPYPGH